MYIKFFYLLLISIYTNFLFSTPSKKDSQYYHDLEDVVYLYSYPHSGTNFLANLLVDLTNRNIGHYGKLSSKAWNQFDVPIDYALSPIFVCHGGGKNADFINTSKHLLIVLVRNFKETSIRNLYDLKPDKSTNFSELVKTSFPFSILKKFIMGKKIDKRSFTPYFEILKEYETWPEDRKLMIFYEELVTNPEAVAVRIIDFLHLPEDFSISERVTNLQQKILKNFSQRHKSYTSGKDLISHSKMLTENEHHFLDNYVRETFPIIWDKYLSRYSYENTMGN